MRFLNGLILFNFTALISRSLEVQGFVFNIVFNTSPSPFLSNFDFFTYLYFYRVTASQNT